MKTYTLLIADDVLLAQMEADARKALRHGHIVKILDTPSGEEGASLAEVELTAEDYNTILIADQFANTHGAEPQIAVTEYPPL